MKDKTVWDSYDDLINDLNKLVREDLNLMLSRILRLKSQSQHIWKLYREKCCQEDSPVAIIEEKRYFKIKRFIDGRWFSYDLIECLCIDDDEIVVESVHELILKGSGFTFKGKNDKGERICFHITNNAPFIVSIVRR